MPMFHNEVMEGGRESVPFSDRLRRTREAAGLTQAALARRAGLDTSYISRLERSEGTTPRTDTLSRLVYALGLTGTSRDDFLASAQGSRYAGQREPSTPGPPAPMARAPSTVPSIAAHGTVPGAGVDAETERARLELGVRDAEERLRALDSQVESLTDQLGQVTASLQSALARYRYVSHDLHQALWQLARFQRGEEAS